jgi:magnesium transporter
MRATAPPPENLQERLAPILQLLEKHELVEAIVEHQDAAPRKGLVQSLLHRQQLAELAAKLRRLHAADIGHLLEMLPPDRRSLVWSQVPASLGGDVLWDVAESVAETLVSETCCRRPSAGRWSSPSRRPSGTGSRPRRPTRRTPSASS